MINWKSTKFFLAIALTLFNTLLFPGIVNQIISNKKAKKESKFERLYLTNETQENVINLNKTIVPLYVLCMNCLVNNDLINETIEQTYLESRNLMPLLRTIRGIKKSGYKNKKLVMRLIKLTTDFDYSPKLSVLRKNFIESAFLGDEYAISLFIQKGVLAKEEVKIIELEELFNNTTPEVKAERSQKLKYNKQIDKLATKALTLATEKNHLEVVKRLLENIEYDPESSYLSYATTKEMVLIYFAQNTKLDKSIGRNYKTCLENAVIDGNTELIDFLLEHGASPVANRPGCMNALFFALLKLRERHPLAKEILVKLASHTTPSDGPNVLIHILLSDIEENIRTEAVDIVLNANIIDINKQDPYGNTALMIAVDLLFYDVIKLLIAHNADIFLKNSNGETAIDLAKMNLESPSYPWFMSKKEKSEKELKRISLAPKIIKLLEDRAAFHMMIVNSLQ